MRDWNDEFANSAHVPGSENLPATWAAQAADYRRKVMVEEDIPYGPLPRQKLDLVRPEGPSKDLVVFVHGGFWIRCAKSDWTDLAHGACTNGWTVGLPGYTLAPEARISEITQEIGTAIGKAAALVEGPIRPIGHSAGGHLACRMLCRNGPFAPDVLARLAKTVSVSGLHDLRLLQRTAMNEALRLTEAEAEAEGPALLRPVEAARLTCWVGAEERPEFLRQSRLMSMIWNGLGRIKLVEEPGHNHFSILDGLKERKSPIVTELLTD